MSDQQTQSKGPLELALIWKAEGRGVALATVAETWGSAPRPTGSHLVIDSEGNFEGSVSGGCVEGADVFEAVNAIETGKPIMLEFGVADETAWEVGLSCGGRIRVYVEPILSMDAALLRQLNEAIGNRQAVSVVRGLSLGNTWLVMAADVAADELGDEISKRLKSGKSGIIEQDGEETFIQVHLPPPRLLIIGAVHISQALAPMAKACGFDVSIIDPRTAFATKERFPDMDMFADWPVEVLKKYPLDAFTALVAVTHDPKIDDIPLCAALEAGCFYIGALGSKKTHALRVERLKALGVTAKAIEQINAPIGLDIGGANPAEIAVSIMAEIIGQLRQGNGK